MMRRLFWFVSGAAAGASLVVWLKRTIASVSEKMTPANIADVVAAGVRRVVLGLSDVVTSLVEQYRNRQTSESTIWSPQSPDAPLNPVRRHNPPRQRTRHR